MPTTDESGLRRTSVYWVPEVEAADGTPETPTDPNFKLWSKSINNESGESSAEHYESLGIGDYVPVDKHHSVESHERTINYDMYRFPVDSGGNANSPLWYCAKRDIDNQLPATLTHLKIVERDSIVANSTVHHKYLNELGNTHPATDPGPTAGKASRQEIYGRGGRPDEAVPNANPSDAALVTIEATMLFGKVRSYQIDQPSSAQYIHVRSTDAADTNVTVEIEETDGSNSETVTTDGTDGTVTVATTGTFGSVRVNVPDEHAGTIEVYDDDESGTAEGNPDQLLTYIRGTNTYDNIDYDTGVPMVGAGSFESPSSLPADGVSAVTTAGEWDGHPAAQKVLGTEISIANNAEAMEPAGTFEADIQVGTQETEITSNIYGETESTDKFGDHITGREGELRMPTSKGDFVFPRAYVSSPGEPEQEAGTAVMEVEVGFRILEPTDGSDPIQFVHSSNL